MIIYVNPPVPPFRTPHSCCGSAHANGHFFSQKLLFFFLRKIKRSLMTPRSWPPLSPVFVLQNCMNWVELSVGIRHCHALVDLLDKASCDTFGFSPRRQDSLDAVRTASFVSSTPSPRLDAGSETGFLRPLPSRFLYEPSLELGHIPG